MAHETGTASSPNDLADKLRIFLEAQGWTTDLFSVSSPGKRLHMHKGTFYINVQTSQTGGHAYQDMVSDGNIIPHIAITPGTGFNGANAWYDQAGVPKIGDGGSHNGHTTGSGIPLPSGAITSYHFLYDDAYKSLVAMVQVSPNIWRWFAFGETMLKAGAWTGGAWCMSSSNRNQITNAPPTAYPGDYAGASAVCVGGCGGYFYGDCLGYVRADVDAFTGKYLTLQANDDATPETGKQGYTNLMQNLNGTDPVTVPVLRTAHDRASNAMNSLTVLLPIQVFAARDAGGFSLLGELPNVFAANITQRAVGVAYPLEADNYIPFPGISGSVVGSVIKVV